jgi:predicted PurR-regulated permease PerM
MNTSPPDSARPDLGYVAAVIALAIGMIALAALLYYLIDILLVLFLGVIVAATLQPGHQWLARWGVPKALAVLLFYGVFLLVSGVIAFFIGPTLVDQVTSLINKFPELYGQFIETLSTSTSPVLQQVARRLPTFPVLTQNLVGVFPTALNSVVLLMSSAFTLFLYFAGVLAIGFYWTMEVPHLERLVVSLFPVTRRPQVVTIWHEVESKLGAFVRGQGIAMLAIGGLSAVGYWLIGLPNVLVLATLAGIFEAVPIVGPVLSAVLALVVGISQGVDTALLVLVFCIALQLFENNILIPPLMEQSVGISSLVGLFAVLAFGALYGVLGALVAIPLTVVIQVVLDRTLINPEPVPDQNEVLDQPLSTLHTQLQELRQRLRSRLRERESRMQAVDTPAQTADQVADSVEQKLERAVEQVETLLASVAHDTATVSDKDQQQVISALRRTAGKIEHTLQQLEATLPHTEEEEKRDAPVAEDTVLTELEAAAAQVEQAVQDAGTVVTEVKENNTSDSVIVPADNQKNTAAPNRPPADGFEDEPQQPS